ncbi:hypothetical protein Mal35_03110 [Gimesia maris]|nr:hypothetical protein Mal35_03110 [Gimesia maris]
MMLCKISVWMNVTRSAIGTGVSIDSTGVANIATFCSGVSVLKPVIEGGLIQKYRLNCLDECV